MSFDYIGDFEDPDLQDEYETSREIILLNWLRQLEDMSNISELEDLEEL
jgi:hypothetical protein